MYRCAVCGRLFERQKDANSHEANCTAGMTRDQICRRGGHLAVGRWFRSRVSDYIFFVADYNDELRISECKLKLIKEYKGNLLQTTMNIKSFVDGLDQNDFIEIDVNTALEGIRRITKTVMENKLTKE